MMYTVNQPPPQGAVYDSPQQYQARQPAPIQMLSEVATPYYGGEPANAPGAPVMQHQVSSNSSSVFQQNPTDRNTVLQTYPSNMANLGNMAQAQTEIVDEQDYNRGGLDEAYKQYQNAIRGIFSNISNGILVDASQALLEVSDWLLSHVGALGKYCWTVI